VGDGGSGDGVNWGSGALDGAGLSATLADAGTEPAGSGSFRVTLSTSRLPMITSSSANPTTSARRIQ
jgi:hypothetical protein